MNPSDPPLTEPIRYTRNSWKSAFPEVFIHAPLEARDQHPDYAPAKAGDLMAAQRLVESLLCEQTLQELAAFIAGRPVFLAGISALETTGYNAIPDAMASEISFRLNWPVEEGEIRQSNKVGHTRADPWHRFVTQAEFAGIVTPGANYILVDDHVGFGGTLANLKGYIEQSGGVVLAMTTLTETPGARKIALQPETLEALRSMHGKELESIWQANFGYGLECCTQLEAGYLCRQQTINYIRRRMAKAAKKASERDLSPVQVRHHRASDAIAGNKLFGGTTVEKADAVLALEQITELCFGMKLFDADGGYLGRICELNREDRTVTYLTPSQGTHTMALATAKESCKRGFLLQILSDPAVQQSWKSSDDIPPTRPGLTFEDGLKLGQQQAAACAAIVPAPYDWLYRESEPVPLGRDDFNNGYLSGFAPTFRELLLAKFPLETHPAPQVEKSWRDARWGINPMDLAAIIWFDKGTEVAKQQPVWLPELEADRLIDQLIQKSIESGSRVEVVPFRFGFKYQMEKRFPYRY